MTGYRIIQNVWVGRELCCHRAHPLILTSVSVPLSLNLIKIVSTLMKTFSQVLREPRCPQQMDASAAESHEFGGNCGIPPPQHTAGNCYSPPFTPNTICIIWSGFFNKYLLRFNSKQGHFLAEFSWIWLTFRFPFRDKTFATVQLLFTSTFFYSLMATLKL